MESHSTRSTLINLLLIFASALIVMAAVAVSARASVDPTPSPIPSRIVLNPTAQPMTSQSVTWRTDAATETGGAEIQTADGGATTTVRAESGPPVTFGHWEYSSRHHSAVFTGLSPDTEYRYRVGDEGNWSEWKRFRTADDRPGPWQMLYFGDAQNGLDTIWPEVASRAFDAVPDARLQVNAGDLVNNSDNDVQWADWFAAVEGHADRIPTFAVTGNHERSGDPLSTQFSQHFDNPGNGPALARDTVYYADYKNVRFVILDGNGTDLFGQESFLKSVLANNPQQWTVVSFHQPIFSGAEGRDNPVARAILLPILEQYDVDLVLQGHDHVYARGHVSANETGTQGVQTGPVYTVAVAGSKYYELAPAGDNNWTQNGATRVKAFNQVSTFQQITFDEDRLEYRAIIGRKGEGSDAPGVAGDLLDSFTITRDSDGSKKVEEGIVPREVKEDQVKGRKPTLKIRSVVRNRKNGTAKVLLVTNASGRLKVSGKGIRTASRSMKAGKRVAVRIRAKAGAARKLRRMGKLAARVRFHFRAADGQIRMTTKRIVLRRMKR